mgnify:CR=1 FL=1
MAVKKSSAKKPATKKAAAKTGVRKTTKPAARKPAARKPAATKPAATKPAARKPASRTASSQGSTTARRAAPKPAAARSAASSASRRSAPAGGVELPKPRFNKDGFGYTKDFDLTFVKAMHDELQAERIRLTGQAKRLEDEANQLIEEAEMGDVQFDDEGGEGDTMVVERERDLALSAQARDAVAEIDAALDRIMAGTYGYSIVSGHPIPRERLEAIPWASVLVQEKVGGIGR